jgi:hypothetical protein
MHYKQELNILGFAKKYSLLLMGEPQSSSMNIMNFLLCEALFDQAN